MRERNPIQEELSALREECQRARAENEALKVIIKEKDAAVTRYTEKLAELLQKRFPKESMEDAKNIKGEQDPEKAEQLRNIPEAYKLPTSDDGII